MKSKNSFSLLNYSNKIPKTVLVKIISANANRFDYLNYLMIYLKIIQIIY